MALVEGSTWKRWLSYEAEIVREAWGWGRGHIGMLLLTDLLVSGAAIGVAKWQGHDVVLSGLWGALIGGLAILAFAWAKAPFVIALSDRERITLLERENADMKAVAQSKESTVEVFARIGQLKSMLGSALTEYTTILSEPGDQFSRLMLWTGKISGLIALSLHAEKARELGALVEELNNAAEAGHAAIRPTVLARFQFAALNIYPVDVDLSVPASFYSVDWERWSR